MSCILFVCRVTRVTWGRDVGSETGIAAGRPRTAWRTTSETWAWSLKWSVQASVVQNKKVFFSVRRAHAVWLRIEISLIKWDHAPDYARKGITCNHVYHWTGLTLSSHWSQSRHTRSGLDQVSKKKELQCFGSPLHTRLRCVSNAFPHQLMHNLKQ